MTTEEQINKLETRIAAVEQKQENTLEFLGTMDEKLNNIERGIYGDKLNKTQGLIERQNADEKHLSDLEERVAAIEKDTKDSAIKSNTTKDILTKIYKVVMIVGAIYLISKDIIGFDTLFQHFFK